ncbi:MAG TPA: hypothetical protein VNW15_09780 [Rhizomicrobium sp.]|nr:hypothetical protein [Rhizomicrobium sp.]
MTNTPVSLQFPANPSLEHLRKAAKEHLKAMRLASGDVTLSEAQFRLARSYGFSSWRALKEEVERRRGTFRPPTPRIGTFLTRPPARSHWMLDAGRAEQAVTLFSILPLMATSSPALLLVALALQSLR